MDKIPLSEIFDIKPGNSLDLTVLETCENNYPNKVNYVSRTEKNNGVSAIVKIIDSIKPFPKGLITVAGSGNSVLESCIQPMPFYTGYHVFVLKERKELTDFEKLFYCFCIKQNRFRYGFGRQANKTLGSLLIPKNIPEEFNDITLNSLAKISHDVLSPQNIEINIEKWKTFKYGGEDGIFEIIKGYYNKKPDHTLKGNIPFVGSSEFTNGVTEYYSIDDIRNANKDEKSSQHPIDKKLFPGNCVTVSNNGSVGNAFYQPIDFTCSHDVNVLLLKDGEWNKYIALFICTIIKLEKYRWSYGRKWRPSRMLDSEIKLPVTEDGKPDFEFMENYIKSLPYSTSI
ncbi:restriction endonuclease subunit S [Lacihabitans sp. LS3-19]|uniref:restriction endonuclease subunit S n=1 Tax=Lacihabitans sp. LS3-19 TaxID=2487335 RepID=UPI0020CDFBFF|nr:restriction endonuclease subunit S [Lacihabitans sp. LS3-19]